MENKSLKTLKPISRVCCVVSLLVSALAVTFLVMYNFADVFTIYTDEGTKYAEGFSYPGWQSIFAGVGGMIIQGYTEATFNIWTFLGCFVPLFACIVAFVIILRNIVERGTNKKKAIVDIIAGITLIAGGIILANCDKLWIANAKNVTGSYTYYYEAYLVPAMNGELYFGKDYYPDLLLVICVISGVVKLLNAGVLLFQKYYARYVKNHNSVEVK